MDLSPEILVIGAFTGLGYGVLAVGLVLVHRFSRTINFAHGQLGSLGAAVLAKLVLDGGVPFVAALVAVVAGGVALGAATEVLVVRRLAGRPPQILLVATLGVAQVLLVAQLLVPRVEQVATYPSPLDRSLRIGDLLLRSEHFLVLALLPAAVVGLSRLLSSTPLGTAIRASAENPDAARLVRIPVRRIGTVVWALAGGLAVLAAVLLAPLQGAGVNQLTQALGPALLLRALAAALAGRLESLPRALAGGVVAGMAEAALLAGGTRPGTVDVAFFLAVAALVALLVRSERAPSGTIQLTPVEEDEAPPAAIADRWWVRHLTALAWGVVGVAAALLPLVQGSSASMFLATRVVLLALAGLSLVVLTGWAGQLSLGQFALVGVGSFTTAALVSRGVPFVLAVVEATFVAALVAVLVGLPALRVQGLYLAVLTLGFAVAAVEGVFTSDVFLERGAVAVVERPGAIDDDRAYYLVCLAVLVVCALAVAHLRRTGVGRAIVAGRGNPQRAESLTVSARGARLVAYALSGALAGLSGALLAAVRVRFGPTDFPVEDSLRLAALVLIGGVDRVGGAVLGALWVLGVPAIFDESLTASLATSGVGLLVLLLLVPGGLSALVRRARARLLRAVAARIAPDASAGPVVAPAPVPGTAALGSVPVRAEPRDRRRPLVAAPPEPALEARGVTVTFGRDEPVLDAVDLVVPDRAVHGLIGSNGAGKSTLLSVLSGFTAPEAGRVLLRGADVTDAAPHVRARMGLGRVFQDARLFPDLTVLETLSVALEGRARSEPVSALLALPSSRRAEATKASEAAELVDLLGLGAFAHRPIAALSTGTRRVVELGCLVAQRADVLLLDEPTAGVAQRDAEAFGPLLLRVRAELDATIVLVEHDLPLVLSLAETVQCLAAGRTIAEGPGPVVREDPAVVSAYLGSDERVVARSSL